MDHLLDLLDEQTHKDDNNDRFIDDCRVETAQENETTSGLARRKNDASTARSQSTHQQHQRRRRHDVDPTEAETATADSNQSSVVCVDDKIGIRMMHRTISSVETLDLLSEYPYHSPAQLASFSLQKLNQLLIDPVASIVNDSTVVGRTSLITMGLMFSNTGCRVSQSGNAFCKIEIGNLYTGPTLSILLFGTAMQHHCKLKAGTVVAILNPRLLPNNNNNKKTALTLSLSDKEQLVNVAQARDYGTCKAMCRAKVDGRWTEHAKRCRMYVDTRHSQYCKQHLTQQQRNNNNNNKTQQKGSLLRQLQSDAKVLPTATGRRMYPPDSQQVSIVQRNQAGRVPQRPTSTAQQKRATNPLLNATLAVPNTLNSTAISQRQRLTHNALLSSNPHTALIQTQPPSNNALLGKNRPVSNPYAASSRSRGPSMTKTTTSTVTTATVQSRKRLVTADTLLQQKKKQKQLHSRSINTTNLSGFDGSVKVPQPSKLFSNKSNRAVPAHQPSTSHALAEPQSVSIQDIRAQQQAVALQLRRRNSSNGPTNSLLHLSSSHNRLSARTTVAPNLPLATQRQGQDDQTTRNGVATTTSQTAAMDSLFGGDIDLEAALQANSRYAEAAESEDYARSRQLVNELEEEEGKRKVKLQKKKNDKRQAPIETSYKCKNCRRTFRTFPKACQRGGHAVQTLRTLRERSSVSDQRLALSHSAPFDDGLRLGQGLEWSKQKWKH